MKDSHLCSSRPPQRGCRIQPTWGTSACSALSVLQEGRQGAEDKAVWAKAAELQHQPQCLIPGDLVLLSCGRGWPFGRISPFTAGTQAGAAPSVTDTPFSCPPGHHYQILETEPAAAREGLLLLVEGSAQQWIRSITELTTPAWLHYKASHCCLSLWCQHTFGGQKFSPTTAPSSGWRACPERNKGENTADLCWSLRSLAWAHATTVLAIPPLWDKPSGLFPAELSFY